LKTRVIQDDVEPLASGINQAAPVVATGETEVAASREVVWDVLTDIERWPSWNPDVRSVSMDGGLLQGAEFRWKAGPAMITSTLQHVDAPRRIAWSGTTFGIGAIHVYVLDGRDGATLVRTEESYDGRVARLFRGRLQKTLEDSLESGLRHLKAEAERRTSHQAPDRRS
jgi:carbon monoxide dehydrogenase subunit G